MCQIIQMKINKKNIREGIIEIIDNKNISTQTQSILTTCWNQRDKLVSALLKIYASNIEENNQKFQDLISQMKDVKIKAEAAGQGLAKTADKINLAVKLAKSTDSALDIAALLVPL